MPVALLRLLRCRAALRLRRSLLLLAFHPRTKLHHSAIAYFFQQSLEHFASQIGVRHLAASAEDRRFDLIALFEEAQHVVLLELVVVLIDVNAELYFLDGDDFLVLFRRALLLLFFIEKLAVVLNATDRRVRGGRNLHQVQSSFTGDFERLKRLHDAELSSGFVDYADFAGANTLIDADKTLVDTFLRGVLRLGTAQIFAV